MRRFGLILMVIIVSTAFLVSCQKGNSMNENELSHNEFISIQDTSDTNNVMTEERTHDEAPSLIVFNSIDHIAEFVQAANGSEAQYEQYQDQYDHYELRYRDQAYAREIAFLISGHYYPFLKSDTQVEIREISYALEQKNLIIIYWINGTRYRFIYEYGKNDVYQYETEPLLDDLPIHTTTMDLYQRDTSIVGYVTLDTMPIFIGIHTNDPEQITMEHFNFCQIDS